MKCRLALTILLPIALGCGAQPSRHDDSPDGQEGLNVRFNRAVKELRSDDAAERDKGSAELEAIAKEAPELVLPLAKDADPEVKGRALEVLGRLHLLPETAAEALFRKVEEKYANAKTLQYKVMVGGKDEYLKIEGTEAVAARIGNVFNIDHGQENRQSPARLVSDGKLLIGIDFGREMWREEVLENCGGLVRDGMVRVGLWRSMDYFHGTLSRMSEEFPVESLEFEKDEKVNGRDAKVLSYKVKVAGQDVICQEKLWIDAEKEVLLKREATSSDGTKQSETYSDTKFDEEIPDEKFALPKETKEK